MYTVKVVPSGETFSVQNHETVLDAALRAGVILEYGCQLGECGDCKAKLVSGLIEHGRYSESALSASEREAGFVLCCQVQPRSDCEIEARLNSDVRGFEIKTLPCRISALEFPVDDVAILKLQLPRNQSLRFLAGQYLEVLLADGEKRAFSMANSPLSSETLELHIRHVVGGKFTDRLFGGTKVGEVLRVRAPLGSFYLREDLQKPIVFVASGTGFAPIKSIVETTLAQGIRHPMTLYWGGRRPKDLYMNELAESWVDKFGSTFKYIPVISDAVPTDNWSGRTGFVHRAVMADLPDLSRYRVYACGVPVMIDAAKRDFVGQCSLRQEDFFCDSFVSGPGGQVP